MGNKQIAIEDDNSKNSVYKDKDGGYHVLANLEEDAEFLSVTVPSLANSSVIAADANGTLIVGDLISNLKVNAYNVDYSNSSMPSSVDSAGDALDYLSYRLLGPIDITSFINNVGLVEVGTTVSSVTVSWSLNSVPVETITLTDAPDVVPTNVSKAFTGLSLTTDKTYTLAVTDSQDGSDSATTSVLFGKYVYWGQSASATPNEGIIKAASNGGTQLRHNVAGSRARSFTQAGGSAYIYYAYPKAWGASTLYVNGFLSTWNLTEVNVTSNGQTAAYYVYTSPYVQAGSLALIFS